MANRSKKRKRQSPTSEKFNPEKEEQVRLKQLVKDERTRKIAGSVALLASLFLFIAFISYLFTWREDQDKVFRGPSILLPSEDVQTVNLLGNFGAYISHMFFYNGFGISSFLFCSLFFVIGINSLLGRKVFSLWRNIRYVLVGILFFSVLLAFVAKTGTFPWGGAVGDLISQWLVRALGNFGTGALLFVTGLAYIIWRFNPAFSMPKFKKTTDEGAAEINSGIEETREPGSLLMNANKLNGGKGVLLVQPDEEIPVVDFTIIEKEPGERSAFPLPTSADEMQVKETSAEQHAGEISNAGKRSTRRNNQNLELEINPVQEASRKLGGWNTEKIFGGKRKNLGR